MYSKWRRFRLLRTRVLLLILLSFLPAFILVLHGNYEQERIVRRNVRERAVALARAAAATQDYYIKHTKELLGTLEEFRFLTLASNKLFSTVHLANLRLLSPDYSDFGLIELDGSVFASSHTNRLIRDFSASSMFKGVLSRGRFTVGTLTDFPSTNHPSLVMGYPVRGTNGAIQRVIYAALRLPLLSQNLRDVSMPANATLTVLDTLTNVVSRHPDAERWVGTNITHLSFARQAFDEAYGTYDETGLDGQERLFAVTTVRTGGEPVFRVAVGLLHEAIFAEARQGMLRNTLIMLLVAGCVLIGGWIYSDRLLVGPAEAISSAAMRLTQGDLSARTGIANRKSELHVLAANFDAMAESLAQREAEIRKINAELEQRVMERTRQLEVANKELEAFSYSVSHDLRAPLRHMDGFARMLLEDAQFSAESRSSRYLNMIIKSARQMGTLIDDLLSFSRMGRQTMSSQPVDMDELLQLAIADLKPDQAGREIVWNISKLGTVTGDPSMLRQVWVNLLSNAIKYTRGRNPTIIEVGSYQQDGKTVFFVGDNGAGFEMKYADKLFGVFHRLHREEEFEGTGIGLANVRRIIQRHHGETWAEGELDKGAKFFFSIPDNPQNPPAKAA